MNDFFAMDGYGGYVWSSFAISMLALAGLTLATWRRGQALKRRLDELERRSREAE